MAAIAPASALDASVTEGSGEQPSPKTGPTATPAATTTPATATASAPASLRRRTPRLAKTKPNPMYSPPATSSPRSNLNSPDSSSARSTSSPFPTSSKRTRRTSGGSGGGGGGGSGGGSGGARSKGRGGGSRLKFKVSHGASLRGGLGSASFDRIRPPRHRFGSAGAARCCTPTLPRTTSTTALPGHAHHSHVHAPHYTRGAQVAGGGDGYKGAWTDDEDQLLQRHVDEAELDAGGRKRWTEIAKHVPRRNGKQCRERWTNHLQDGYVRG